MFEDTQVVPSALVLKHSCMARGVGEYIDTGSEVSLNRRYCNLLDAYRMVRLEKRPKCFDKVSRLPWPEPHSQTQTP